MAKQRTDRTERGEGDASLMKATATRADGTVVSMADVLAGSEPTAKDGETVGIATGELYDAAVAKASPPGDSNGNGGE